LKTNLFPKLIQVIDDNSTLLWFEKSNRYVVTSKVNSNIIKQYMNPDESRDSFIVYMLQHFKMESDEANTLYDDITIFLNDINSNDDTNILQNNVPSVPTSYIEESYRFFEKIITIRFETELIKSLVHPQIAHHTIKNNLQYDILFDIFKTDDDLHLLKNGIHVGSYKTQSFHFLQGRFALELTNTIHNTQIDNWIAAFHASTVANGKESIMIIGDSGNGKSTLSVLLMAHGLDILCDDFTPLYADDLKLYRYPAATSIKKGAFDALKPYLNNIDQLKTHTSGPKKVNIKYVPPIHNYEEVESYFPCHKIVYVKYNSEADNSLNRVSSGKVLETLIPDSWISPKEEHAVKFINWLKNVQCYELNYHSNDFAISKFRALFEES